MKLFVVLAIFCLTSCAIFDAQKRCVNDPACLEDVKGYAKVGEVVASPFGPIAGAGATAVLMLIGLTVKGWKKKDEK